MLESGPALAQAEPPETAEAEEKWQLPETTLRAETAPPPQTAQPQPAAQPAKQVKLPDAPQAPASADLPEAGQPPVPSQAREAVPVPEAVQVSQTVQVPEAVQVPQTVSVPEASQVPESVSPYAQTVPHKVMQPRASDLAGAVPDPGAVQGPGPVQGPEAVSPYAQTVPRAVIQPQGQAQPPWAPRDYDTTAPLDSTQPLPDIIPFGDYPDGKGRVRRGRPHRFRRFAYRSVLIVATVLACLVIGSGVLLVGTPSAGQATVLAARIARQHHVAYPGPPPPATFTRPLVATEDHRFYSEVAGIDPLALARLAKALATRGPDQGGSTIEMQLAKMLWIGDASPQRSSIKARLKEVALAVKLDARYSKAQVLRLYSEVAYYGHGYYGLEQASCGYFGHPSRDLTVTQGAMLAGVVNAPALDDPIRHPGRARARLAHVISRMAAVGDLTPQQAKAALSAPLSLTPGHSPSC